MLVTSWLPASIFPRLNEYDFAQRSMRWVLSQYRMYPARQHKEVEVGFLSEEEGRLLQSRASAPGLLLTYLNYSSEGQPYEYRKMMLRGDRSKYYVDVGLPDMF